MLREENKRAKTLIEKEKAATVKKESVETWKRIKENIIEA